MKTFLKSDTWVIGLAMFSMFFGAGNIIFPLAIGQYAGDKNIFAMLGLILTAAIMPLAGVIAMILFEGNYREFFGRLGRIPGFILALTTISLLGPLGSTPRCIALSYTTFKSSIAPVSSIWFSAISCCIIFLFAFKKNHILTLLGWVLTPVLLGSLTLIIAIGLINSSETTVNPHSGLSMFLHGLGEGYNTMDLLASFFFSSTIIGILKNRYGAKEMAGCYLKTAFKSSLIGASLLALIYIGFSYLAAYHGHAITISSKDELLSAITMKIAGPWAGPLVAITIILACFTTAIALISAFSDFIQKEIFGEKLAYEWCLLGSLILTFFISTFEFTGISAFLWPLLQICYPGLILLTLLNIANRLWGITFLKIPVFLTFITSCCLFFIQE